MKQNLVSCLIWMLAVLSPLEATSVKHLTFDELVAKANTIVEGDVVSSNSHRSSDGKLILTDYLVSVKESIKGNAPQTVTVTTIGGKVGNTVLRVSGMPVFQNGEKIVLFLEQSKAYTTVVGLNQGKFTISNGEVSNSVSGLTFPGGLTAKPLTMPVDEFKHQIKLRAVQ
jgi:hypothetical protein